MSGRRWTAAATTSRTNRLLPTPAAATIVTRRGRPLAAASSIKLSTTRVSSSRPTIGGSDSGCGRPAVQSAASSGRAPNRPSRAARAEPELAVRGPAGPVGDQHGTWLGRLAERGGHIEHVAAEIRQRPGPGGRRDDLTGVDPQPDRDRHPPKDLEPGPEGARRVVLSSRRIAEDRYHTAADEPLHRTAPPIDHVAEDVRPAWRSPAGRAPGRGRPTSRTPRRSAARTVTSLRSSCEALRPVRVGPPRPGRLVRVRPPRRSGANRPETMSAYSRRSLVVGLDVQLLAQALDEPAEPTDSDVSLALRRGQAHQASVRLLVHRIDTHQALERRDRPTAVTARLAFDALIEEKPHHARAHLHAAQLGPLVEAVLRKQVAGVDRERLLGVAPPGGRLERVDVDPQVVGLQADQVVPQPDLPGGKRPPREMQRLGQPPGTRRLVEIGPQHVDQLFAVHPVAGRHGQQLDQRRRAAAPPGVLGHRATADLRPEPAEHRDAQITGHAAIVAPVGTPRRLPSRHICPGAYDLADAEP